MITNWLHKLKGREKSPPRISYKEMIWSGIGAFCGIYLTAIMGHLVDINLFNHPFLIASLGASAILLYGVPQAELSQPRNLLGGHVISALIGVMLYQNLQLDIALVAALAVAVSIVVMQLTRTLHPPGGATALIAVIGGSEVHQAGYLFVVFPVLSSAMMMLLVAVVVNNVSGLPHRNYPRYWL
jgi:CBS domain-containing membrane protein